MWDFFPPSSAAGRFPNALDGSSYFPGSTVTEALGWISSRTVLFFYKTTVVLEHFGKRRPSFSVFHLILARLVYLKTGTKICFSDAKVEQYWCFALRSALIPSLVMLPIFPSAHPPREAYGGAPKQQSKSIFHKHCTKAALPGKHKHLGRMVQTVLTIIQHQGRANTHTQPWKTGSAPVFCSSDIALDARR